VPPTHPYELSMLAWDLVLLSRYLLKPNGRLVFFLPTVTDEYAEVDIPQMEGMHVIANSLENFGAWGRRVRNSVQEIFTPLTSKIIQLITMVKTESIERGPPNLRGNAGGVDSSSNHVPAHKDFREKYFAGFNNVKATDIP
jgi:tRNA (guanine10-N2)-methyltransferase